MSSKFKQKPDIFQRKQSANENNLTKLLAIHNFRNTFKSSTTKEAPKVIQSLNLKSSQDYDKLNEIMTRLRKDISFIVKYGIANEGGRGENNILKKIDLLSEYIGQVMDIKETIRKGRTTFIEILRDKQKNISETLNEIWQGVFKLYLKLDTKEKYSVTRTGGQIKCIFTMLGIIEKELQAIYNKISQWIIKRNARMNIPKKAIAHNFSSSRSLPSLRTSKQRSKETKVSSPLVGEKPNIEKFDVSLKTAHNFLADKNIKIPYCNSEYFDENISCNNKSSKHKKNKVSFLNDKENKVGKINIPSHDNGSVVKGCDIEYTNSKENSSEFKATGFEISISKENIQIKIPKNIIYLSQDYNNSLKKDSQGDISDLSYTTSCSTSDFNSSVIADDDSDDASSLYTEIVSDPDIPYEECEHNNIEENSKVVGKPKNKKIYNYDKCIPFISDNHYCFPTNRHYKTRKENSSDLMKGFAVKESGNLFSNPPLFHKWKQEKGFESEQFSHLNTQGVPLFNNVLQIIDIVKQIHQEQPNITTSNANSMLNCTKDCPPLRENSSIWKKSASHLCDLCPGCISWVKMTEKAELQKQNM